MSGIKIVVAVNRRQSGASRNEGKKEIVFEVYRRFCEEFYKGNGEEYLFAHTFLTMELNLMSRSDKCINMHVQHIQCLLDCLIFYFGTWKDNHTGELFQPQMGQFN